MNPSNTSPEGKSEQLWATYSSAKSKKFWRQYEKLLKNTRQPIDTATKKKITKLSPVASDTAKKVFYPDFLYLAGKIGLFLTLATIPTMFVSSLGSFDSSGLQIFSLGLLLITSYVVIALLTLALISSFEIKTQHLVIQNPLLRTKKVVPWQQIQSISVLKDESVNGEATYYQLIVKTITAYQYTQDYRLSSGKHQAFFAELRKKGITIEDGGYRGYLVKPAS